MAGKSSKKSAKRNPDVERLQAAYDGAKTRLNSIGDEPPKPSNEKRYFGSRGRAGAPADLVTRYDAEVKAHKAWRSKYLKFKKAEVAASNALFHAKRGNPAKRRNRTVIKAKRVTVVSANPRKKNAHRISPEAIKQFPPHMQAQYRAHWDQIEASEEKAATPAQRKQVALKKRSFLSRLRTRLNVLRKSKKFTVTARDTARCPTKKIKVRALTADNALSHAKNKLGSRYDRLKVQNGKKRRNPAEFIVKYFTANGWKWGIPSLLKPGTWTWSTQSFKSRAAAVRAGKRETGGEWRDRKRNGAIEKAGKFVEKTARRTIKASGKILTGVGKVLSNPKRKRRNDGAESRREEFAGAVTGHKDLFFAEGTPQGLSTLGPLVLIGTEAGTIKPTRGGAYLCQDARGHLYIGGTRNAPLWNGPRQHFGKVSRIEYECAKPQLGEPGKVIWFHDFEDPLPRLSADGKGGLHFQGGGYTIRREGIVG